MPRTVCATLLKGQKKYFRDAEAIAEAVQRPTMKFVATETADQLGPEPVIVIAIALAPAARPSPWPRRALGTLPDPERPPAGRNEVAPASWTPELWSFRSPQWQESTHPMRRNSAGR